MVSKKAFVLTLSSLITTASLFVSCKKSAQDPEKSLNSTSLAVKSPTVSTQADSILKVGYAVEQSLPKGYVKDGSVDYTTYIQQAINKNNVLVFPAFAIQINDKGLVIGSNKKILFENGSTLILKPSSKSNYNILCIYQASNVTLINPVVQGDRNKHTGSGSWGMGISIYSGKNITVTSPKVTNCWGDGIYVGRADGDVPASNVVISNSYCDNNRRNGISVTSVNGLVLSSPYCGHSNGTLPQDGIDIEPNDNGDEVNNIFIANPKTESNAGEGIQVCLSAMQGSVAKQANINISNHTDLYSPISMLISCYNQSGGSTNISGKINISNPDWVKSPEPLRATWVKEPKIALTITKPVITNTSNTVLSTNDIKLLLAKAVYKLTNFTLSF